MPDSNFSLEICRPVEDHARLIMAWRNDPATLAMSFHGARKNWPRFFDEFRAEYFAVPDLPPVLLLEDGARVGFLRFREVPHPLASRRRCVDISIIVAPERRGRGLGKVLLDLGIERLAAAGVDTALAEILPANAASLQSFASVGYRPIGRFEKRIDDTGECLEVERMVYEVVPVFPAGDGVFVIAEAGSNWRMGTIERDHAMGRALIEAAAEANADAVKFQTYRAESVYVANAGASEYLSDAGITQDITKIFRDLAMPYEMIESLAAHAKACGIAFMSSPFSPEDFAAVDPHVSVHKIASYEISHPHLLRLAAESGKPLVLSTGASTEEDIAWAVREFRRAGGRDLCLMQCTARYPAGPGDLNLAIIPWLKARFGTPVGLSDHSREPLPGPIAAVALGATAIEKHFTLDRRLPGPDHAFAIDPEELRSMVAAVRSASSIRGERLKRVFPAEEELAAYARRRIQSTGDIRRGERLSEGGNFAVLRPGTQRPGVHPKHLSDIEGRVAARDIPAGDGILAGDWE